MSNNLSIENFPVKVQDLPSINALINSDSFIVDRPGEYTGKVSFDSIVNYIFQTIGNSYTYLATSPIGLSANTFYIPAASISFDRLSPDVQDAISRTNCNPGDAGTTLTGSLSTFTNPVTATGEFLIINVNDKFKAVKLWDFPLS